MTLDDRAMNQELLLLAEDTGWAAIKALIEGALDAPTLPLMQRRYPWLHITVVPTRGQKASSLAEVAAREGNWSSHLVFVSGPPKTAWSLPEYRPSTSTVASKPDAGL